MAVQITDRLESIRESPVALLPSQLSSNYHRQHHRLLLPILGTTFLTFLNSIPGYHILATQWAGSQRSTHKQLLQRAGQKRSGHLSRLAPVIFRLVSYRYCPPTPLFHCSTVLSHHPPQGNILPTESFTVGPLEHLPTQTGPLPHPLVARV